MYPDRDVWALVTAKPSRPGEYAVYYTMICAGRHEVYVKYTNAPGEAATVSFAVNITPGPISHIKSHIQALPATGTLTTARPRARAPWR
jgi:hypothetical protein